VKTPSSRLVQGGGLAAMIAGLGYVAGGLLSMAHPQAPPEVLGTRLDYLGTSAFSIATLGVMGALVGLHARQAEATETWEGWASSWRSLGLC
jgi:hypothetical protein